MLEAMQDICRLLSTRRATLFLGAGINAGIRNKKDEEFPLGDGLARLICRDLLEDELLELTLDEAAEYARSRVGPQALNKYLFNLFSEFNPGLAHSAAIQVPWDTIYTTNFDSLLEKAAEKSGEQTAGKIKVLMSFDADLSHLEEQDIPYYKLHGSIDLANTIDGQLILTKEDYQHYEQFRRPLFNRLRRDLTNTTCVFVGYSMMDANFRDMLEECRKALDTKLLPRSYAIRPGYRKGEAEFWLEKYNVHLVDATAEDFLRQLRDTWFAEGHVVMPLEKREAHETFEADESTRFPRITDCFFRVLPEVCTGQAQPQRFFLGAEPTWADIRDKVAPHRTLRWTLFETMFEELADPMAAPSAYLVTGHAGTGKTTLLRSLAYTLAEEFDTMVVVHIGGTPLEAKDLRPLVRETPDKRIVVLVHDAAEYTYELRQLYLDAIQFKLPLSLLLEDRTNQWNAVAASIKADFSPDVFEVGALNRKEIIEILDALETHDALGRLASLDRGMQIEHFIKVADKDLLVALRELTSGTTFDCIIKDEYSKIPSALAQKAYAYAAVLGQVDLYIRNSTLLRLLDCEASELSEAVFKPTEGVLISSQFMGRSRHTIGYRVRTRHPVIASIVFSAAAVDDLQKLELINSILSALDPGYHEDRQLLHSIIRRRGLVKTLSSEENQRGVYHLLAQLLPNNAYVFQHRSILEKELGAVDVAIDFARKAKSLMPNNPAIANTLGLALEKAARSEQQPMRRQALLSEASSHFDNGIKEERGNPFGYLGRVYVLRQRLKDEKSVSRSTILKAEILSTLETAREETDNSPVIEGEIAQEQNSLGKLVDAIATLEAALEKQPSNERIANLLIRFIIRQGREDKELEVTSRDRALKVVNKSIGCSPNSWRLHRYAAQLQAQEANNTDLVTEHYEAAIRNNKKEVSLYVELASYLFTNEEYGKAKLLFVRANKLPVTSQMKHKIYNWFMDENNKRRQFFGRIERMVGAGAFVIAVPENFEAFFWRRSGDTATLVKGDEVKFYVGFNCRGAVAEIIEVVSSAIRGN